MNELMNIESKILFIRGQQVMLDRDLAELYGVETKRINEAVRRNIERFPEQFMFKLTKSEQNEVENRLRSQIATLENLKSQNLTSSGRGKYSKYLYYAFTEQGIAMLSAVLHSLTAIQISIKVMEAFVKMRHYLLDNAGIITRLTHTEIKLLEHDKNFEKIFSAMHTSPAPVKQKVFSKGPVFDAYTFFQELIHKAQKEIILIDSYVDLTVLERLSKKNPGVDVTIYTLENTPITQLDIDKFDTQYPSLSLKYTSKVHDRFLILDNREIYHVGASLKDLGKKCFAFTQLMDAKSMIKTVLETV